MNENIHYCKMKLEEEAMFENKSELMSFITMVTTIVIATILLVCTLVIVPKAVKSLDHLDEAVTSINETLPEILEKTESLLDDTNEKLAIVDIEALNGAIRDLSAIVEPIAKIFGK